MPKLLRKELVMSIKAQLAVLYENRELPMDEYRKLTAFSALEQEKTIIEKIEVFHLPEVTKLICGSEVFSELPWAEKYREINPLYCKSEEINVDQIICGCKTADRFEECILRYADARILQSFKKHYEELSLRRDSMRKERSKLTKKIKASKKENSEMTAEAENSLRVEDKENGNVPAAPEVQPSAEEKKLETLKRELADLDRYLRQHKEYIKKINAYEEKLHSADDEENREKAYRVLGDLETQDEEAFLRDFIGSGVVSEGYHKKFRNQNFVNRVLRCLEKGSFKEYSLPVLLKLYDEGAIDLIEGPASVFLNQHPERLCDYLVEKSPISVEDLNNPELEMLIEKAIQKELSDAAGKNSSFFSRFWNTIIDRTVWCWIISKVKEVVNGENIDSAVGCLMIKLEGRAAKSFIEVLFDDSEETIKVSSVEVMSYLLKNEDRCERDVIIEMIRLLEQKNRKKQRKLNTSERKLRSYGQELFSSVYLPMEQLEELAVNLKLTKGEIKASLVAAHLIDIVLSLREGFEAMDLLPIAGTDDWKYQNKIEFDPNIHCVTMDNDCAPDAVRLRSLGFRYQNDDGEWKQYNARASVETNLPEPEKKPRKGYPKYEQPGRKKSVNGQNKHRFDHKKK